MKSDDHLYQEYLAGNQTAGDELLLRHGEDLLGYLDAFLHNAHDAEDLMLDVFTIILVDKPKIREGNFKAYLYTVARNKANRLWRLRFRRTEFELDERIPYRQCDSLGDRSDIFGLLPQEDRHFLKLNLDFPRSAFSRLVFL